jgi:hypothetical protein
MLSAAQAIPGGLAGRTLGSEMTAREAPVDLALSRLAQTISVLDDSFRIIEQRTTALRCPAPVNQAIDKSPGSIGGSHLVTFITEQCMRLEALNAGMRSIINELEI